MQQRKFAIGKRAIVGSGSEDRGRRRIAIVDASRDDSSAINFNGERVTSAQGEVDPDSVGRLDRSAELYRSIIYGGCSVEIQLADLIAG